MKNNFFIWKNIILFFLIFLFFIYFFLNFYRKSPSIQIIENNFNKIDLIKRFEEIKKKLQQEKITFRKIEIKNNYIVIYFFNSKTQFFAYEKIKNNINDQEIIILDLLSSFPKWLSSLFHNTTTLRMDLKEKKYFLIKIDIDHAKENIKNKIYKNIFFILNHENISYVDLYKKKNNKFAIKFLNKKECENAKKKLSQENKDIFYMRYKNNLIYGKIKSNYLKEKIKSLVIKNFNTLKIKLHTLGMYESIMKKYGDKYIIIELPGTENIFLKKRIINFFSNIELREVNNYIKDINIIRILNKRKLPVDYEIKFSDSGKSIILNKNSIITGEQILDIIYSHDKFYRPQINIILDNIGGKIMYDFTSKNINTFLAILLIENIENKTEKIINIAKINSKFSNNFKISGMTKSLDVYKLALLLKSGIFFTPIKIVKERMIHQFSKKENTNQIFKSFLYIFIFVIFFIIFLQKKFGIIFNLLLTFNFIIIFSIIFILSDFIFTVPVILGLLLTIILVANTNILIKEKVKEENKNNDFIKENVYKGYKKAIINIIDIYCINMLIILVLYFLFDGIIQKFAIMTLLFLLISIFTFVFITGGIINILYKNKKY